MQWIPLFLILLKPIDCGYSLEPPYSGESNEQSRCGALSKSGRKVVRTCCLPGLSFESYFDSNGYILHETAAILPRQKQLNDVTKFKWNKFCERWLKLIIVDIGFFSVELVWSLILGSVPYWDNGNLSMWLSGPEKDPFTLFILQTAPVATEHSSDSVPVLPHTAVSEKSFRRVRVRIRIFYWWYII